MASGHFQSSSFFLSFFVLIPYTYIIIVCIRYTYRLLLILYNRWISARIENRSSPDDSRKYRLSPLWHLACRVRCKLEVKFFPETPKSEQLDIFDRVNSIEYFSKSEYFTGEISSWTSSLGAYYIIMCIVEIKSSHFARSTYYIIENAFVRITVYHNACTPVGIGISSFKWLKLYWIFFFPTNQWTLDTKIGKLGT